MSDEQFADVEGFEGIYQVSSAGYVRRHPNAQAQGGAAGQRLVSAPNSKGYGIVTLRRDGQTHTKYVHELVGKAFVRGWSPGMTVNHRDRNRLNNAIKNLEFIPGKDNSGHGRISREKVKMIRRLVRSGWTPSKIANYLGVRSGTVTAVMRELGLT